MKILITGSNGLLGQKLLHKLRLDKDIDLHASSIGENRVSVQFSCFTHWINERFCWYTIRNQKG